jgi:hypothetical protein
MVRINLDHNAIATALGTGAGVDDPGHHRKNTTKAQGTEEPKDPDLQTKHTTTKTMKRRWEHHDLLAEFAPLPYPKDSNYHMTRRSTTDLRSHSHGSQIIYKQSEYWEVQKRQQCEVCSSTSPALHSHGWASWKEKQLEAWMNSRSNLLATSSQRTND